MACSTGAKIVTSGLILNLDIANRKSFIESAGNQQSLYNTADWTVGMNGTATFSPNQTVTNENQRLVDTDPWGNQQIVWQSLPSGDSNNDGGWEGPWKTIDNTKLYRVSVWMRRTSSTTGGTMYFGLHTNGTGDVLQLVDSATNGNPYWDARNIGWYTQNQWYLTVGHIFPAGWAGTTRHANTGVWQIGSGRIGDVSCNIGNQDVKFPSNATQMENRTYHFYCTDATSRMEFAYPRIDLIDGTEPTMDELLTNSPGMLKDTSGYNNHHVLEGYYIPNSTNPRKFTLDGSTMGITRAAALTGATSTCTVVIWYSTTDTYELWAMGNQSGSWYLAAANDGAAYYHSNVGSPTNYIDCVVQTVPQSFRTGAYHMWEAKNVDFTAWTYFQWFAYSATWHMAGNVSKIMVYNRALTAAESAQNHQALRGRFSI